MRTVGRGDTQDVWRYPSAMEAIMKSRLVMTAKVAALLVGGVAVIIGGYALLLWDTLFN